MNVLKCTAQLGKRILYYVGKEFYTVVIFHHKSNVCRQTGFKGEAVVCIFLSVTGLHTLIKC